MQARGNRTFICSVAFLDIIEYTRKGVTSQIELKVQLNNLLGEALKDVTASDRIILDTGDGAAISFVGDPEEALFVCLQLRDSVLERRSASSNELNVRIGLNLGPVKLIKDLNGQANIVGDGINVAQRIMSFAVPNQILVSRSYFEVVSCLSESYAKMFHYEGSRTDKHVREHEVYAVGDGTGEVRRSLEAVHATAPKHQFGVDMARTVVDHLSSTVRSVRAELRALPKVSAVIAVVAILVLAIAIRGLRSKPATRVAPAPAEPVLTMSTAPLPAVIPAPSPPRAELAAPAPAPVERAAPAPAPAEKAAPAPAPAEKAAPAPAPVGKTAPAPAPAGKPAAAPASKEKAAAAASKKEKAAAAKAQKQQVATAPAAKRATDPAPASSAAAHGVLAFAIAPWGEIYVNGKNLGVSPPLQELKVGPGRHKVEVRNTSFTPHVQIVEVKSGERIRIRHRFK